MNRGGELTSSATDSASGSPSDRTAGEVILRDAGAGRWLKFSAPRETVVATRVEEVLPALRRIEAAAAAGVWAAGFVAYEAAPAFDPALTVRADGAFPLLWFGLYSGAETVEPPAPPDPAPAVFAPDWQPSVSAGDYRAALERIRTHIRRGDTYQVNYTLRLQALFEGDPWAAFVRLAAAQEAPYAAWVDAGDWVLASSSPELFFRLEGTDIESKPMKGTAARGLTLEQDRAQAGALQNSEKERAENVMIVDMVRNDLGRIARQGSVHVPRLFEAERYPTVWQLTSTVAAQTTAGLTEVFSALFPPASITGAPKVETMRLIAGLETSPRRVYTGTVGFAAPGRRMQFNVAIRTILVDRRSGRAEYGVGSGIVWDSDPDREWAECRTKARVLTALRPPFQLLETLRWSPGEGFALMERHLRRLADSAEYFGFRAEVGALREALDRAAAAFPAEPRRVRLLVDRAGHASVESAGLAPLTADGQRPRVAVAARPVDPGDVFLYHKTTHRRVYEEARAARPDCADVLLVNTRGEVTESTMANLAVLLDRRWVTPPADCGLLPGVERAERLARGELAECILSVADLRRAERVCLMNSVRGMWEVEVITP